MKCPKCQHENRASARFCFKCGEKLQEVCPQCGSELVPNAEFCDQCGVDLTNPQTVIRADNKRRQEVVKRIIALQRQFAGRGIDVDASIDEHRRELERD